MKLFWMAVLVAPCSIFFRRDSVLDTVAVIVWLLFVLASYESYRTWAVRDPEAETPEGKERIRRNLELLAKSEYGLEQLEMDVKKRKQVAERFRRFQDRTLK